jgi:hypothetical protein
MLLRQSAQLELGNEAWEPGRCDKILTVPSRMKQLAKSARCYLILGGNSPALFLGTLSICPAKIRFWL